MESSDPVIRPDGRDGPCATGPSPLASPVPMARRERSPFSSEGGVRPRPSMFRALGHEDPPAIIHVNGVRHRRLEALKHDSWAATAMYADERGVRCACKFNRVHRLVFLPMAWLG